MGKKIGLILVAMWIGMSASILLTPASSRAAEPIIVGVPTSLYTPFGRDGLKAVNMAVEEICERRGFGWKGEAAVQSGRYRYERWRTNDPYP